MFFRIFPALFANLSSNSALGKKTPGPLSPSTSRRTLPSGAGDPRRAARICSAKDGGASESASASLPSGRPFWSVRSFPECSTTEREGPSRRSRASLAATRASATRARNAVSRSRARFSSPAIFSRSPGNRAAASRSASTASSRRRRSASRSRTKAAAAAGSAAGGRRSPEACLPTCVASATRICNPSQYGKRRPARSAVSSMALCPYPTHVNLNEPCAAVGSVGGIGAVLRYENPTQMGGAPASSKDLAWNIAPRHAFERYREVEGGGQAPRESEGCSEPITMPPRAALNATSPPESRSRRSHDGTTGTTVRR